jgi:hypothetical protein
MRHDVVAVIVDASNNVGITLGEYSAHIDRRFDVVARECFKRAKNSAPVSVLRPTDSIEIGQTGFERITHRADAGPFAIGPPFECDAKKNRNALTAWPAEVRGRRNFCTARMYVETGIHYVLLTFI